MHGGARTGAAVGVGLLGLSAAIVAAQPWHGATLLTVAPGHGVDEGDLLALALLIPAASALAATSPGRATAVRIRATPAAAAAAGALGVVLLLAGGLDAFHFVGQLGPAHDALSIGAFLVAFAWTVVALGAGLRLLPTTTHRGLVVAGLALVAGFVVDGSVQPSGTLFGPAFLAAVIVITGSTFLARALAGVLCAAFMLLNVASLADLGGLDVRMSASGGGRVRSAALGALLVVLSVLQLREARRHARVSDHSL